MVKNFLILLLVFCTFMADAQIKTRRNYDFIGHEVNSAGLRVVGLKSEERSDGKYYYTEDHWTSEPVLYGCIDSNGNEVITIQYKTIVLGKDIDYIYAIKPQYRWKSSDGKRSGGGRQTEWLFTADGEHSIGNVLGESRATCVYTKIYPDPQIFKRFKCSIAQIYNDKYGIANIDDSRTISPIYDNLFWINYDKGYLAANLGGYWGIIDYLGREIVAHQWTTFKKLDHNFWAVELNDLWGIIDNDGNEIVPFQFNEIKTCKDNIAIVVSNDQYGAFDLINRKQIIPFGLYYSILDFNGKTFWGRFFQSNAYVMQLCSIDGTVLNDLSSIFKKYKNKKRYSEINVESRDDVKEVSIYDEKNEDEPWIHYYFDDNGQVYNDFDLAKAANDAIRKAEKEYHETNELASLMWLSSTESVQDKTFNLFVRAQSNSEIQDVYLIVNGTAFKDLGINKLSEHEMTISKEISLNEGSNTIQVCVRNAAGTTKEEKTIVYRPQGDGLPSIEWIAFDPTSNNKERLLKFGIKSKSKIEDVTVTVNGSQVRGIKTVDSDKYDMVIEHPVNLMEGTNLITVSVRNREGIVTKERSEYYSDITPTPVFNDKRIALVIGNSDYSKPEMKLKNPKNDAQDIAKKLEKLGFHVILKLDATLSEMNAALAEFEQQAVEYDMALFYFAGHGIQSKGENFLLPTNIDYLTEGNLSTFCLPASQVMNQMEATNCKLKIAVFDACRNDPLSRQWRRGSGLRGLSMMDSPDGTIIAFSTAPGHTASDGTDRNSPYTEAFLEALDHPGLSIRDFFPTVGELVKKKTNKMQTPWMSTCFTGDFYFNPK